MNEITSEIREIECPSCWQRQGCKEYSIKKAVLLALGIISILAAAVSTCIVYPYIGNYAFIPLAAGTILGLFFTIMGFRQITNVTTKPISNVVTKDIKGVRTFAERRLNQCPLKPGRTCMQDYSDIEAFPSRVKAKKKVVIFLKDMTSTQMSERQKRAMGIMCGLGCGDFVGAPFEFLPYKKEGYNEPNKKVQVTKDGFINFTRVCDRFQLKPGQWTDDTSMGLCLAATLLENKELDATQLMWAFSDWWRYGYNNAFAADPNRPKQGGSVGLGGNISDAFEEFGDKITRNAQDSKEKAFATEAGNEKTSGNGSLMRLGPVAIVADSEKAAMALARKQSKVTHQGEEAAGCCELMAFLLFHALHSKEYKPAVLKHLLFEKLADFHSSILSVHKLAQSEIIPTEDGEAIKEDWNWKNPDFSFNAHRLKMQGGTYVGSYAMDGLAMALHCVYTTDSFEDAVLKAATRGGDADSVGAITGQIAGAIYGIQNIPSSWLEALHQWDRGGDIATRAYLLT